MLKVECREVAKSEFRKQFSDPEPPDSTRCNVIRNSSKQCMWAYLTMMWALKMKKVIGKREFRVEYEVVIENIQADDCEEVVKSMFPTT